jgi:microcystin-dependent protein
MEDPQSLSELIDQLDPVLNEIRRPRAHLAADPTFTPKNFIEQIQFEDTGTVQKLFLYINKVWRSISVGSSEAAGIIKAFGGASAPAGYLLCDGSAVSRTTYAALFTVIGTTYGVGDGSTTFNVPNLKGKVPVGYDSGETEFNALGKTGGEKTHTLTVAEMPSHTHSATTKPNASFANFWGHTGDNGQPPSTETTGSTGGDGVHNNLQPYLTLNFIIKT